MAVTHVQLALSTICLPRRHAFPVAAPLPHQLVRPHGMFPDNYCHVKKYATLIKILLLRVSLACCVTSGSSSCTCIGKNRAFQQSDGSCLCRTGFIFYNELDFRSSTSDSEMDCQPEVSGKNFCQISPVFPPWKVKGVDWLFARRCVFLFFVN